MAGSTASNDFRSVTGPASQKLITPSDTVKITDNNGQPRPTTCLLFGGSGNVAVRLEGDADPVIWPAPAVGVWHPARATHIYATNTDAGITTIIAGWSE